jgi:glycosyltransferase involved in cell wall biosynthesis
MKVLVLHSELGVLRGGGETVTKNLFTAFADRGHYVAAGFVANGKGCYPFPIPESIEPIPVPGWWSRKLGQATLSAVAQHLPVQSRLRRGWDRVQEAIAWRTIRWHNRRFQRRVEREFADRWADFDVIYVQSNVMLASRLAPRHPTVLMLPGPVGPEMVPALRRIHAVCAHDDGFVQLRALLGDKVVEVPLGLDVKLFSPGPTSVRSTLRWTDQRRVIGYVGRLANNKGVDLLREAFHQLSRTISNARLLIVGSGEEERNIRSVLKEELARGLVHIEPAMDQTLLPNWYRAMDLLVMPSKYETMSNSLLEALACGVPFLASNVGGNRTIGETGAGWLFEPGSIPSLAERLSKVIAKDPGELIARGNIGRRYVGNRYSWAASAERLEQILTSRLGLN